MTPGLNWGKIPGFGEADARKRGLRPQGGAAGKSPSQTPTGTSPARSGGRSGGSWVVAERRGGRETQCLRRVSEAGRESAR